MSMRLSEIKRELGEATQVSELAERVLEARACVTLAIDNLVNEAAETCTDEINALFLVRRELQEISEGLKELVTKL